MLDHGRRVYYFESALSPYVVGLDLAKIDFAPGSGIRSVALEGEKARGLAGDIGDELKPAQPMPASLPVSRARCLVCRLRIKIFFAPKVYRPPVAQRCWLTLSRLTMRMW